jgi:hypothetical protein
MSSVPNMYSLMNFVVNNQEHFQIHLYTILIQVISTIFIDQISTYLVFKKVRSMLASKFSTILKSEKTKFKVALRKYLNMLSFHSVDEFFNM